MAARGNGRQGRAAAIGSIVAAILSVQIGAGLATDLFSRAGPVGVVSLRLLGSAAVLMIVARPHLRGTASLWRAGRRSLGWAVGFGAVLAVMNLSFYQALSRLPQGAAVTIEFTGPLALSVVLSRRRADLGWVAVAAGGVLLLGRGGLTGLSTVGVLFGFGAAACWAAYILLSRRVGAAFPGIDGLALASVVGAVAVLPVGISVEGARLWHPVVLVAGLAVGLLSSALPYGLELRALRTIDPRTFGVLMSAEPAAGALVGFVVLGQHLTRWQVGGIALVALASAATTLTRGPEPAGVLPGPARSEARERG